MSERFFMPQEEITFMGFDNKEASTEATYEYLGPLHGGDSKNWKGSVSLEKRIESGELSSEQVNERLSKLNNYFIPTTRDARVRCIDGRPIADYSDIALYPKLLDRGLGPQVPGGTPGAAIAYRVVEHSGTNESLKLVDDIDEVAKKFGEQDLYFNMGCHIDDGERPGFTGCGAIDKIPQVLDTITRPMAAKQIREMTQLIEGDDFNPLIFDLTLGKLVSLQGIGDSYFEKEDDGDYQYREKVTEKIRDHNHQGVEKLVGPHNEVAIVINFVPNTTLHRDEFSKDSDNKVQVFGLDYWFLHDMAEKLYPDNDFNRRHFLTWWSAFSIGVAQELTDGTPQLIVRK